jgi:HSP20 family protein
VSFKLKNSKDKIIMNNRKQSLLPTFTNVLDNIFNDDFFAARPVVNAPAFNIKEEKDGFAIEIAAPGLKKEDFNVELKNGLLTISAEQKTEDQETFQLPKTVDATKVSANYESGVLTLALPKKEEAKELAKRTIEIA